MHFHGDCDKDQSLSNDWLTIFDGPLFSNMTIALHYRRQKHLDLPGVNTSGQSPLGDRARWPVDGSKLLPHPHAESFASFATGRLFSIALHSRRALPGALIMLMSHCIKRSSISLRPLLV